MSENTNNMNTGDLINIIESQIVCPDANENTPYLAAVMMRELDFSYESEGRFVPPADLVERDLAGLKYLDDLAVALSDEDFELGLIANKTLPSSVLIAFEERYTDVPTKGGLMRKIGAHPSYPVSHAIDVINESDDPDLFLGVLFGGKVPDNDLYHSLLDVSERFGQKSECTTELKAILNDKKLDPDNYNSARFIGFAHDDQLLLPGIGEYVFENHNEKGLERAKKGLVRILEREAALLEDVAQRVYASRDYVPDEIRRNDFYIRADAPEVVLGSLDDSNQIVFKVAEGWVAKAKKSTWKKGEFYGMSGFLAYSRNNDGIDQDLRDIGIENVPEHHYFGFADGMSNFELDKERPLCIVLTKDITEGGRYELHEVDGFDFSKLANGEDLQSKYQSTKSLLNSYANGKVAAMKLYADRHGGQGGADKAIARTFFCAVDPVSNVGKLVAGDLDNIYFRKDRL